MKEPKDRQHIQEWAIYVQKWIGLARTMVYIYGVYTVFLAGKPPNIRSYTVLIYGLANPRKGKTGRTRQVQRVVPFLYKSGL